ncbi:hypothetical protein G705_02063, partial [Escherichia coli HVH 29 (4-3418073)]
MDVSGVPVIMASGYWKMTNWCSPCMQNI